MLVTKLHQFLCHKNVIKQPTIAPIKHIEPHWTLFERMNYADQLYNKPKPIDHAKLQIINKQRKQTLIEITEENFSENVLTDAIAKLPETGGEIRLPKGRIEIKNTLRLKSGVYITGQQEQTDLVFKDCDYGFVIQGCEVDKLEHVSIKNIRIFHEGEHKFCAAIFATHCEQLLLENITIISPRSVGILLADQVIKSRIINCCVQYAGLVGFMFIRDVNETLMKNCVAEFCQQSGVFLTDLKLPETINPTDFQLQLDHTDHEIGNFAPFSPRDPSPYRTDIIDCIFSHNRKMGITTDGIAYLSVKNTVISNNDCEGITIDNGSWGCLIQNCHIYNNGWRGLQHEVELGIDLVRDMGLMDDGSSKAKLPGISLDNAAYTRIEHNHIEGNWGDGIKFVRAAYAGTVANNLIENNNRGVNDKFHYYGVLVGEAARQHDQQHDFASCNNQISENTILGSHFAGIHLMAQVMGNIAENNYIKGATYKAIENHTEAGNSISNNLIIQ